MATKLSLTEILSLSGFSAGSEVVLLHQNNGRTDYAVHGTVARVENENRYVDIGKVLKLDIEERQLKGAVLTHVICPQIDFQDPKAVLEYFRGQTSERSRAETYIFTSFARWKAYKIEPNPTQ